nr:hypothetical protein [Bifidobacterium amazonense]
MRRVYGLSLDPLWSGTIGATEYADLFMGLPDGSLTWIALDSTRAWTLDQHLLAGLVDRMTMWMWSAADPKKRGPRPEPLPRPGNQHADKDDGTDSRRATRTIKPVGMSVEELDRFMSQRFEDTGTVRPDRISE